MLISSKFHMDMSSISPLTTKEQGRVELKQKTYEEKEASLLPERFLRSILKPSKSSSFAHEI